MPTIGDAIFVAGLSIVVSLLAGIPFIVIFFMWGSNFGIALFCEIAIGFIGMVVFSYFLLNAQEKATEEAEPSPSMSTSTFEERYRQEIERRRKEERHDSNE